MFACWWYLSRLIKWREIRHLSRVVVAVSLLTPWYSDVNYEYLAPAFIISTVEGITNGGQAFWRAGTPLLIALIFAVALSLGWTIFQWRRAVKNASVTVTPEG